MANKEKSFNTKLYAIVTFIVIAVTLAVICVTTFSARYTAFHPDELAKTYVDTIVQSGDGYNAYKNTLASKSTKYGDFIRTYYIYPAIYRDTDYKPGDNTENYTGYNDESYMSDATKNDNGTLSGKVIDEMYQFYETLVSEKGWDDYGIIYSSYIEELIKVREEVFGDKYFTDEIFFTAFEANVATYADSLTGTEDVYDENTGVQLSKKSTGAYEEAYGEDYKFTVTTGEGTVMDIDAYKSSADTEVFATYGVCIDDISEAMSIPTEVKTADGTTVASVDVVVVKIGSSWYVDNTATDTDVLYSFYLS